MSADRVSEAIEVAREHLEWCSKHWHRRKYTLIALGLTGLDNLRRDDHAVRVAAVAAAWLGLQKFGRYVRPIPGATAGSVLPQSHRRNQYAFGSVNRNRAAEAQHPEA
jgi:hypothetical protein